MSTTHEPRYIGTLAAAQAFAAELATQLCTAGVTAAECDAFTVRSHLDANGDGDGEPDGVSRGEWLELVARETRRLLGGSRMTASDLPADRLRTEIALGAEWPQLASEVGVDPERAIGDAWKAAAEKVADRLEEEHPEPVTGIRAYVLACAANYREEHEDEVLACADYRAEHAKHEDEDDDET